MQTKLELSKIDEDTMYVHIKDVKRGSGVRKLRRDGLYLVCPPANMNSGIISIYHEDAPLNNVSSIHSKGYLRMRGNWC